MRTRDMLIAAGVIGTAAAAVSIASSGGSSGSSSGGGVSPPPAPGPDGPPSEGGSYWPPSSGKVQPAGYPVPPLPAGKGIFVRHVKHGGPPELFAKRCAWMGLRWVMIQAIWQNRGRSNFVNKTADYAAYGEALRAAGVTPWVFGYCIPEAQQQFVDVSMSALDKLGGGPGGIVINPEAEWYRHHHDDAAHFVELLRSAMGGLPLGMTSYGGGPPYHPPFPWKAFSTVDFGLPQIYDVKERLGDAYPRNSVKWWTDAGYRCVPVWAAYPKGRTPEQMADIAARTPLPFGAVCWWDLYWLIRTNAKKRIDFVRQYYIPEPEVA